MAILGFTTLAVLIALYAYTSGRLFSSLATKGASSFVAAFYCLSSAVFIWLIAAVVGNNTGLFVFAADILLLIASGLMLSIVVDFKRDPWLMPLVGLFAALFLTARAYIEPSTAYIDNGLLHFDLSPVAALIVGSVLLVCWLPAGYVTLKSVMNTVGNSVFFLYTSTVLMTCFFIASTKPATIITSFLGIIFMFLFLIIVNAIVMRILQKTTKHTGVKHAATR